MPTGVAYYAFSLGKFGASVIGWCLMFTMIVILWDGKQIVIETTMPGWVNLYFFLSLLFLGTWNEV